MMRWCMGLMAALVVAGLWLATGRTQEPKQPRDPIMRQKLDHAQKVLEGIAVKNFDLLEKHADHLITLSNKAEWRVLPTPAYALRSDEFRWHADSLVQAARNKNLDGAALAYVQLTMSCVNCHKYVREVRMARLDER